MKKNNHSELGIADILNRLRDELHASQKELVKEKKHPLFRVAEAEIELKVIIKQLSTKSGKMDFKIVALHSGHDTLTELTHILRLRLVGLESVPFGLLQDKD